MLQVSLKRLCSKEDLKQLSFWGKIFCTNKNYFVAKGMHRVNVVDSCPANWEESGAGCNKLSFWVTNGLMEDWVELPVIGPEHLCVAFETKVMLTGNLNSPIQTYPPFPGKEKHFLKAQIVRITFSSSLSPGGVYKLNEENERETQLDAEFAWPGRDELYANEKWVHMYPQVLKSGRITHYVPKHLDEEQANELKASLEEKEPYVERLRAITEDTPFEGYETNYLLRQYGDKQIFASDGEDGNATNNVCTIRSLTWPGFYTIASSRHKTWSSLYFGTAIKAKQVFIPNQPSDVKPDPDDVAEMPEPNHKEEPKVEVEGDGEGDADADADGED